MKEHIIEDLDHVVGGGGGTPFAVPKSGGTGPLGGKPTGTPGLEYNRGQLLMTPDLMAKAASGDVAALQAIMNAGKASGFGPFGH